MRVGTAEVREMVWEGRLWRVLLPYGLVWGLFVVMFAVVVPAGDHLQGVTLWHRVGFGLISTPVALMFAFVVGISPRRLTASKEGLELLRWFGVTTRVAAVDILGVRASPQGGPHKFGSIYVDVRGRKGPLVLLDVGTTLLVKPVILLDALQGMYGKSALEEDLRAAAASREAVELSQVGTRWRAKGQPRWPVVLDIICPPLAIAGMVFWQPLWEYAARAGEYECLAVFVGYEFSFAWFLLWANGLITGGPLREVVVDGSGLTFRRRWRDVRLEPGRIVGVQQVCFYNSSRREALSSVRVYTSSRWFYRLREQAFETDPKGLLAGVLLHRYGELLRPNTSAPPAV